MLVVCPDCVSSYRVEPHAREGGTAACYCAHCRRPLRAEPVPMCSDGPVPAREAAAWRGLLAGLVLVALISGLLFWHGRLTDVVPGAEGLYRLAGLDADVAVPVISDLKTSWQSDGLAVAGTLANPGGGRLTLPLIRITVRDGAAETLYSWTVPAPRKSLGPGESVGFASRLDQPPAQGRDLVLGFVADHVALSDGAVRGAR